jgi:hypothetical protein
MAKGDTLSRSADQRATDSLNHAVLNRINGQHDTMPIRPTPVPPVPTDSTKPAPTDSLKPVPTDPIRTPPPLPLDTIKPVRDTTTRDTTKH